MSEQRDFPSELLSQSPSARIAYFKNKVIAHPHLKDTHTKLWQAIQQPSASPLIFVFGPTGVGKTTLRWRVEQQLWEAAQQQDVRNPGCIPVVGLEVPVSDTGNFGWRDYYKRALIALDEPMIEHKARPSPFDFKDDEPKIRRDDGPYKVTADLRWALEQALRYRRPAAFILDEAQHFKKIASGRRLLDQMDTLKSLANLTNTVHILIGTYELLSFTHLSAQLDRRSYEIHFPRYRIDVAEEMLAFKRTLFTFQRHLPLVGEPDLVSHAEYLYERSAGCVGILKDWLVRTLAAVLEDGRETFTQNHLEQYALPVRGLLRMAREIHEGESALACDDRAQTELRSLLDMPVQSNLLAQKPDLQRSVGKRKPIRDSVGHHEQES